MALLTLLLEILEISALKPNSSIKAALSGQKCFKYFSLFQTFLKKFKDHLVLRTNKTPTLGNHVR